MGAKFFGELGLGKVVFDARFDQLSFEGIFSLKIVVEPLDFFVLESFPFEFLKCFYFHILKNMTYTLYFVEYVFPFLTQFKISCGDSVGLL